MLEFKKKNVLILCTGNSCRSQMAEGIAKYFYSDAYDVVSAGTQPSYVHPHAITVMKEIGINISQNRSKSVHEFDNQLFDFIITVCSHADQNCPIFPGPARKIHWGFEDPAYAEGSLEDVLQQFRVVRDAIVQKFQSDWRKTLQ